jgi:hypothetical protein
MDEDTRLKTLDSDEVTEDDKNILRIRKRLSIYKTDSELWDFLSKNSAVLNNISDWTIYRRAIEVASGLKKHGAEIAQILESVEKFISTKSGILELPDIQYLAEAAKKVGDLANLDPNNGEIPILRKSIEDGINSYFEPAINWFNNNKEAARLRINEIEDGLFDKKLQDLILGLNFNDLQKMDQNRLDTLIDLCYEIANKTKFESPDDIKLRIFQNKIRASLRRGSRAEVSSKGNQSKDKSL